jgi:hypothetical protein
VQKPQTSGPWGWPAGQTPWLVGPTLQPLVGSLNGHTLQEAVTRNLKLEVGGSRTRWPANTWRVTDFQVSNSSLDPYKYRLADRIQDITLYMEFSTCKGSSLVVLA